MFSVKGTQRRSQNETERNTHKIRGQKGLAPPVERDENKLNGERKQAGGDAGLKDDGHRSVKGTDRKKTEDKIYRPNLKNQELPCGRSLENW